MQRLNRRDWCVWCRYAGVVALRCDGSCGSAGEGRRQQKAKNGFCYSSPAARQHRPWGLKPERAGRRGEFKPRERLCPACKFEHMRCDRRCPRDARASLTIRLLKHSGRPTSDGQSAKPRVEYVPWSLAARAVAANAACPVRAIGTVPSGVRVIGHDSSV